eukprot:12898707-Alexandrium_andersonii.AAC.1
MLQNLPQKRRAGRPLGSLKSARVARAAAIEAGALSDPDADRRPRRPHPERKRSASGRFVSGSEPRDPGARGSSAIAPQPAQPSSLAQAAAADAANVRLPLAERPPCGSVPLGLAVAQL